MNNNKLYQNYPEQDYHNNKALGSTDIKTIKKSLETFYYRNHCKELFESENKKSLLIGSAFHLLVSGGVKEFLKEYKIRKKPRVNKFIGKGENIITVKDWQLLKILYRKIKTNPLSKEILDMKNIQHEVSYFWQENEVNLKCRFDMLINNRIIVDIKTIDNTTQREFDKLLNYSIRKYEYNIQAQHYLNGLKHYLKNNNIDKEPIFIFLFVEKSMPYRIGRKILSVDILQDAQFQIDYAITKYKEALKKDYWIDPITEKITLDDIMYYQG